MSADDILLADQSKEPFLLSLGAAYMKAFVVLCLLSSVLLPACVAQARTWCIKPDGTGDAPTIQAGIDSAAVGDSVILECGTYYEFNIELKSGIYLGSSSGMHECATINGKVQGTVIKCEDVDNSTTIAGLTITRGQPPWYAYFGAAGGGMSMHASSPTLANCRFFENYADHGDLFPGIDVGAGLYCEAGSSPTLVNCAFVRNSTRGSGGGLYSTESSPTLINCTFSENSANAGGGVTSYTPHYAVPTPFTTSITLSDCVFSKNLASGGSGGGAGLLCNSQASLLNCTFVENWAYMGSSILAEGDADVPMTILNTVFAFGQGGGWAIFEGGYPGYLTLSCCDIYGNVGGNWVGSIADQLGKSGNFSLDPQFCDIVGGSYTLKQCSPCASGNHPQGWGCGLIGALPVGCPGTAVEETTWGHIKATFR